MLILHFLLVSIFAEAILASPVKDHKEDLEVSIKKLRKSILRDTTSFTDFAKRIHKRNAPFQSIEQKNVGEKLITRCSACVLLMALEQRKMGKRGGSKSLESALQWIESGCEYLNLEAPRICKGTMNAFGQEIIAVFSKVDISPEEICGLSMPDACKDFHRFPHAFSHWTVPIPPNPIHRTTKHRIFQKSQSLRVLHLSDVHIDMKYLVDGKADCDQPVCCREKESVSFMNVIKKDFKLHFSSANEQKAMKWGDYRNCDLPWWTFEDLLKQLSINSSVNPIDYILFTGDLPAHDIWAQTKRDQIEINLKVTALIRKYFPNTPVYPAVGNHDSFPANNFPPRELNVSKKYEVNWLYATLAEAWRAWLPTDALETVTRAGFYTAVVKPGFRIVSLNTNLCYTQNYWLWLDKNDPEGMLGWFVNVLTKAEAAKEMVQVIGHVPPGRDPECLRTWSENYFRIIERFHHIIAGQFFGHTHYDEIQIIYDSTRKPISVAYIAPSVTSYTGMMPSYRVYEIEPFHPESGWSVLNHQTYVMNFIDANATNNPSWKLEYDACQAYNLTVLGPEHWDNMASEWLSYVDDVQFANASSSLARYLQFYQKLHPPVGGPSKEHIERNSGVDISNIVCDIFKNKRIHACSDTNELPQTPRKKRQVC